MPTPHQFPESVTQSAAVAPCDTPFKEISTLLFGILTDASG
jgi:hypothetical protein